MNEMESAQKKRRGSTESFSESEGHLFALKLILMHILLTQMETESGQYKQKPSSMVQLRSNKALIVRHTHTKLNLLLDEFRIPLKPTMATEAITDKYNEIREKGLGILDLRKQVEKVEHDLKVVQAKRVALESGGEPPPPEKKDAAVRKFCGDLFTDLIVYHLYRESDRCRVKGHLEKSKGQEEIKSVPIIV